MAGLGCGAGAGSAPQTHSAVCSHLLHGKELSADIAVQGALPKGN